MGDVIERLSAVKSYPQRTPEWHAIRGTLITASDAAAALDIKPYEGFRGSPREDLMKKKLSPSSSSSSIMMHGVQYEDEARILFSEETGEEVHEFGLCVHPELPWLGASPDGVTRSGKLVEIKCPVTRVVVPGHVPEHYMPQLQVCMEVLDLEEAAFIQYKPESLTWPKPAVYDVTYVARDRAWFAANKDALHKFWEEMMARKAVAPPPAVAPPSFRKATPKPAAVCLIAKDLYEDEKEA